MDMSDDERQAMEAAIRVAVGQRIAVARDLLELTQGALAAKVHVTQPAVSQWERGVTLPSKHVQFALADVLRTTRSRLFRELVEYEQRAVA